MSGTATLYDNLDGTTENSEPVRAGPADSFSTGSSPFLFNALSLGVFSYSGTGALTITLNSDSANSPGATIETLGVIPDSELPQTSGGTLYLTSFTPVLLAANTRYWISLTNNADALNDAWTFTSTASGTGVAGEYYQNNGTIYPSSDGPYRMEVQGDVPCFGRGTLIETPRGETPVQRLRIGDEVLTVGGVARRVVWIGMGRTRITDQNRERATPIIVRKDALEDGVPRRNLVLTRGHSLLVDGKLVPVETLVNGRSILWDRAARIIEYYHVEVTGHAVLFADGAPAETYRDDGNANLFLLSSWPGRVPAEGEVPPCAPIVNDGPEADRLWLRFSERAGRPAIMAEPDLHLLADGERVELETLGDGRHGASLPRRPGALLLCSRASIPAELGHCRDLRRLGVAVAEVILRQSGVAVRLSADAPPLRVGFHAAEQGFRWTDGAASLPLACLAGLEGPLAIEIAIAMTAPYAADGHCETDAPVQRAFG